MRQVVAYGRFCCEDAELSWSCLLCSQVSCFVHDPSPGEFQRICDQCWNPIDFEGDIA